METRLSALKFSVDQLFVSSKRVFPTQELIMQIWLLTNEQKVDFIHLQSVATHVWAAIQIIYPTARHWQMETVRHTCSLTEASRLVVVASVAMLLLLDLPSPLSTSLSSTGLCLGVGISPAHRNTQHTIIIYMQCHWYTINILLCKYSPI